jgi:hypothetical protein
MSKYLQVISEGTILVEQGHADMDFAYSEEQASIADALVAVNKYNIGEYHPDMYVCTPDHWQVVVNSEIVGFIARSEVKEIT